MREVRKEGRERDREKETTTFLAFCGMHPLLVSTFTYFLYL